MNKYIIVLSKENDLLSIVKDTTYKATFSLDNATKFDTHQDATRFLQEEGVRFMWRDAEVKKI